MVVQINPFCPISFGFFGLLGAIVSRRSTLLEEERSTTEATQNPETDFLMTKQDEDHECDELSEDRITHFLEEQKASYYKSIGMEPPVVTKPAQENMDTSSISITTRAPSPSLIEFPSSRETSMIADLEELNDQTILITPDTSPKLNSELPQPAQSFSISAQDDDSCEEQVISLPREPVKPLHSPEPLRPQSNRNNRKSKRASPKQQSTS